MPMREKSTIRDLATKLLLLLAAFLVQPVAASSFHPRPEELTPGQQAAWRATVSLEVWPWRHGTRARGKERGSGLVVAVDRERGKIWIATAAHAVACDRGCSLRVRLNEAIEDLPEQQARVLWRHRGSDLALLEVRWPAGHDIVLGLPALRPLSQGRPGDPVVAMGFPDLELAREPTKVNAKVFSTGRLEARRETFQAPVRAFGSGAGAGEVDAGGVWTHTAAILPGSSGGPLVSASGAVLGLNVGSLARGKGGCVRSVASEAPAAPCLHLAVDLTPLWRELERRGLL